MCDCLAQRFEIPTIDSPAADGSTATVDWTKTPGGYLAAVQDPFLDDKRCGTPPAAAIIFPREPQQPKPPSSFSSLADWAGGLSSSSTEDVAAAASSSSSSSAAYAGVRFYGDWDSTYG